ncbi:MAG TPA: class I SAM-dependent methyltransferase [Gemmatimonadaceae bacterium]|nr:class I SAM-dependent methyltransferase [Gemmatimonadaceae bacterium]
MHTYSRQWFTTFLSSIDESVVAREVAFIARQIGHEKSVLDLCCGPARHAAPLAEYGCRVVGLDLDDVALRDARRRAPTASFIRGDMRQLPVASASMDAVLCMWQSFGHFHADTNVAVLAEMTRVLRPKGRLLLDVYHRDFHALRLGERTIERDGTRVRERRSMSNSRLRAELTYEDGSSDVFDWQLYVPDELAALGVRCGLTSLAAFAEFDEKVPASGAHPRMQLVFSV